MEAWSAVALALSEVGSDRMASRLSTYLHPVAGRPLLWHTLCTLSQLRPAPPQLVVVGGAELSGELFGDLSVPAAVVPRGEGDVAASVAACGVAEGAPVLLVDAAASLPPTTLQALLHSEGSRLVVGDEGRVLAAWLGYDEACAFLRSGSPLASLLDAFGEERRVAEADGFVVECRAELARAGRRVRDRLVRVLMDGGTTFLAPETVLVDVDVRTGRDTVVYPGVVIEGQTVIGDETVVGPYCRLIDAWIGSGVELKGFNYISHTSIRNRAILEPHVRRGFD